jgi:predicted SAM-dependent methyltransferase
MKVNLGCGPFPTQGWVNIDNSLTVRLAHLPLATRLPGRKEYVETVRSEKVRYGTAFKTGLPDKSVEVLYTSHMLEHLDRREAKIFLREARRVLRSDGVLRIVVPDLRKLIDGYVAKGDADALMESLYIDLDKPVSTVQKMRHTFLTGFRLHHWMYDAESLQALLRKEGFVDLAVLEPGETTIADPGELNLREREGESLYIEARLAPRN